ncbi:MAG: hypothetical protein AAF235_05425 [Planctomycetota bacterium]
MALFGKKKGNGGEDGDKPDDAKQDHGGFNPEKARKFFEHAQSMHDTGNYPYAVTLWLNGLAQDPSSFEGFEGFLESNALIPESDRKKGAKDIAGGLQGKGRIGKYQQALLAWGVKQSDMPAALKAADAASALGLGKQTEILGRTAFNLAVASKPKKDVFVKLLDIFAAANCFELALEAGQVAKRLDPSDGPLDARLKEMMARSAISKGGFDDTGAPGGFRKNIRDIDKQTQLESEDAISKTEDVKDRLVATYEAEYTENQGDLPTIDKYGRALLDRGTNADQLKAITLFTKAFKETGQFGYRQRAGEVGIRRMRAQLRKLQLKADAAAEGSDERAELSSKFEQAQKQLIAKEVEELKLQVENYPTDLNLKFELGKRHFTLGEYEPAIELFQIAQHDAKHRIAVLNAMGQSFLKLGGWEDAAIDTFRGALKEMADQNTDLGMELRYFLMCSLEGKGKSASDLDAAEEADKLAAGIAIQKFNYRDIRDRRSSIKSLIDELKAG